MATNTASPGPRNLARPWDYLSSYVPKELVFKIMQAIANMVVKGSDSLKLGYELRNIHVNTK